MVTRCVCCVCCVRCVLFLASCAAITLHKRGCRSVFNPLSRYLTGTAGLRYLFVIAVVAAVGGDGVREAAGK